MHELKTKNKVAVSTMCINNRRTHFFLLLDLSNDVGSQIAVGVILSLLLLALIVLTIVLLVLFLLGQRRQKAVRIIEEKKVRKSKSEAKSKSSDGKHDEKKKHKKTKKKKTANDKKTDENQNMNVSLRRTESMKEQVSNVI